LLAAQIFLSADNNRIFSDRPFLVLLGFAGDRDPNVRTHDATNQALANLVYNH
jgi:hypothetical protein